MVWSWCGVCDVVCGVGGVGGTNHSEHGVSVQARVYGGAQLQKTGGARKMPHITAKNPISDVIRAAC